MSVTHGGSGCCACKVIGWGVGGLYLGVSLVEGVQAGQALAVGLLQVPAQGAQGCHAPHHILHHGLLPSCLYKTGSVPVYGRMQVVFKCMY